MIMLSLEKGVLKRPVSGKVIVSDDKAYIKGMRLEAGSGEIVKCPIDGKVVFCGKFQSFGDLLIIQVSARVRVVLAGLGDVSVALDQQVRAGEKLGNMPKQNLPSFLYLEIRQDDQPMQPQVTFLD
jgi:septal ring factor EnvC (AmiA/AmiB activator)